MHRALLVGAIAASLAGPLPPAAAASIRCGSKLVSEDMLAAKVLAICGEPDLRDVWAPPGAYGYGYLAPTEQWTYNFGSSKLLRVLLIRNGRVARIGSEGYGFPTPARRQCGQIDIQPGMSKYRLLMRCGEPLTRVADYVFYPEPRRPYDMHPDLRDFYSAVSPVYREEWTYNFGSNKLLRIVVLENGLVVDVQTGSRGFDAR